MNLREVLIEFGQKYGVSVSDQETGAQFILTSPLSGKRNQSVTAEIIRNDLYNRQMIRISSVVSPLNGKTDLTMLLEQTSYFSHCRFAVRNGMVLVEAVSREYLATSELIGEMIMEVANLADQYEMKLTGKDQH